MKFFICNAFSLSMLDRVQQSGRDAMDGVRVPKPLSDESLNEWLMMFLNGKVEYESAVGHGSTANLFSNQLGIPVPMNRVSVKLDHPDLHAIIGQYSGPRLEEGATELPEGARIEWWII